MFQLISVGFQHTAMYLQEAASTPSIFSQKGAEDSSMASLYFPTTEQSHLYSHMFQPLTVMELSAEL